MTTLIIHGNIQQFTFANSIVAANLKSLEQFNRSLCDIYVIHSTQSDEALRKDVEWTRQLKENGIEKAKLIERVIDLTSTTDSIAKFVQYLETIVKGVADDAHVMVDLTNGTTFHKNVLSVAAYVLDLRHQYMIDITTLPRGSGGAIGFLTADTLASSYISAPDCTQLDKIAYLNLTEMMRYRRIIDLHTASYADLDRDHADEPFFRDNLIHSIRLKLRGDVSKNNAIYRIAASSIGAGLEELVSLLLHRLGYSYEVQSESRWTFGPKLQQLASKVRECAPEDFDYKFFKLFNEFILYLRNSSTHKGKLLTNLERFKAELAVRMAFPFIEFYTEIIYPMLSQDAPIERPKRIRRLAHPDVVRGEVFYYGLDGDDTGAILAELFVLSSDEATFRELSRHVADAITKIGTYIRGASKEKDAIIFQAGDDLLFKGSFGLHQLKTMQKTYADVSGLTCSIGYGKSFREVYVALKLAKIEPGKNSIVGIEMI